MEVKDLTKEVISQHMNQIIIDAMVQPDVKLFEEIANFNVSLLSGTFLLPNNSVKNRYTYIRVIYTGEVDDRIKEIVQPGQFIRLYGKLDSEQYLAKSGKNVYNKVLNVHKIDKVKFNHQIYDYEVVD